MQVLARVVRAKVLVQGDLVAVEELGVAVSAQLPEEDLGAVLVQGREVDRVTGQDRVTDRNRVPARWVREVMAGQVNPAGDGGMPWD